MKRIFFIAILNILWAAGLAQAPATATPNKDLENLFNQYFEENLQLNPTLATSIGDNRYNHLLPIDFTDSYRATFKSFYNRYLTDLKKFNRAILSENDRISYDIFKHTMELSLEGLTLKTNLIPFNQFNGLPLYLAQLGSGSVVQPFKTVQDYENWLRCAGAFSAWADSAIVYFRRGMAQQITLPRQLVTKMIPQMEAFVLTDPTKSVFYGPVNNMPASFADTTKARLTAAYVQLINENLVPAYTRLATFLKNEYLPKARTSSGLGALPGGAAMYSYFIKNFTTTTQSADQIYKTGLAEVKRIQTEMEKVKNTAGFKGDLKAYFEHMRTDPQYFPYKEAEAVLNDYRAMQQKVDPQLRTMFNQTPKTAFEIRQTEAFRAASAAAQYNAGTPDGSRPGIFYVPIVDAAKLPRARESLFLHEAIPGHHYQVMLQRENEALPRFRRFGGNSAYSEGWGLYAESLGKELGSYTDPYQYMQALGDEIHRAIRLVVDAGLHAKGWTREQAIRYMMDNEPIEEQRAVAEIERYMAYPAQALSYKTGELKLQELRKRYTRQLGTAFNLAEFHDEILKDGNMPLEVLERKMDQWAGRKKGAKAAL